MNRRNVSRLAFAIVVLCFVLSTFVSMWSLRLMAGQNLRAMGKTLAGHIYDSIVGELSEPIVVSRTMANDLFLIDALAREDAVGADETEAVLADYLSRIKSSLGYEAAFVVSEGSRKYYSYAGLNKFMDLEGSARDRWYSRFIETGLPYDLDVDRDEVSQDIWTVFVDARVEDAGGGLLGACGVGAHMTRTQSLFYNLEKEYNVKIDLVDADGVIQVDTDESAFGKPYPEAFALARTDDYEYRQLSHDRILISRYVDTLDWYLVVESDGADLKNQFINVILLNVILCALVLVILILAMRIIAARTRALASASMTDQPTQLLNRRAFEEAKARLALQPLHEDTVVVTADLNGLKTANDTLGHAAGDEMIRGTADCLRDSLGQYGEVYRIGGDEFAAILRVPEARLPEAMLGLERAVDAWRGRLIERISIASGWATGREFPSENIAELSRIADERMYAAKEEYYRKTGKDRRRT